MTPKGQDVRYFAGGGQKVGLFRDALKPYAEDKNLVVIFSDSYDVIFNAGEKEILGKFLSTDFEDARVVFSAEGFCWPDKSLAVAYPLVKHGKRYLNSGLFMGYPWEIYQIVSHRELKDGDDDQLFYTEIFLDENLRVHNIAYNTRPCVIHGNGPSKLRLNQLGNYIANYYSPRGYCVECKEDLVSLKDMQTSELPLIVLAVFVERETPFLEEFLERLAALNYPKSRMYLFLHNAKRFHNDHVADFVKKYEAEYKESELNLPSQKLIDERTARDQAIEFCLEKACDFLFAVDSEVQLTAENTLRILIEQNRNILAPMLGRPGKLWSNFWGSLSDTGFYARSDDYSDILQRNQRGVWNVPFIGNAYLIKGKLLKNIQGAYSYDSSADPDMSFCEFCRDHGIFMFVDNVDVFGHLVETDDFDTTLTNPDMYQIFDNRLDWERRYLNENYSKAIDPDTAIEQPCPDVYYFPLFSERFCWDLIGIMESYGKWSDGSPNDPRLAGGYENVPTRDIHMNQVGFERHWLFILDEYVRPMQEKVFIGYYSKPATAVMNFVVRYRPEEQPFLRPHHDASTYTINVALNRYGMDYEGGGARFIRYDCAVRGQKQGWSLLHPGRLTHFHEGLSTTKGTRYIMVCFANP